MEKAKLGCERLVALFDEKIAEITADKEKELSAAIEEINAKYDERLKFYKEDRQHYVDIIEEPIDVDEIENI